MVGLRAEPTCTVGPSSRLLMPPLITAMTLDCPLVGPFRSCFWPPRVLPSIFANSYASSPPGRDVGPGSSASALSSVSCSVSLSLLPFFLLHLLSAILPSPLLCLPSSKSSLRTTFLHGVAPLLSTRAASVEAPLICKLKLIFKSGESRCQKSTRIRHHHNSWQHCVHQDLLYRVFLNIFDSPSGTC